MPQLDPVTFFSQFFWLCLFFFAFYFVISKDFLPKMGRILKFRKKKLGLSQQGAQDLQQENERVRSSFKAVVERGLNASNNLSVSHFQHMESWFNGVITNINKKQLEKSNRSYVQSVGGNSIRQQIALEAAVPFPIPRIFVSTLVEKCKEKSRDYKQNTQGMHFSRPDSLDQHLFERKKKTEKGTANTKAGSKK